MMHSQKGFVSFGVMTLVIGGLALVGLLIYGAQTGQQLPLWPAIAVTLVNIIAAGKLFHDARKAKAQRQAPPTPDAAKQKSSGRSRK